MKRSFMEALAHRRSHYAIDDRSPVSDQEIEDMVAFVSDHVPSGYNSQSTRMVLLLGEHHKALWGIVKEALKKITKPESFLKAEQKVDTSFAAGHGTVLFFEDTTVVEGLQKSFPLYKDNFPVWSQHTAAMHQLAMWTILEDAGFGASLQHYNPLIDEAVKARWNLPASWQLTAQMPFGMPLEQPVKKELKPLDERVRVFK